MLKQYNYRGFLYTLREAYSKCMPGYIYHVLAVDRFVVEVPCLSDGHDIAKACINGNLDLSEFPRYMGKDEK